MAANKEQREIEIVVNGQKANASLKEMGSAAALMNAQLRKMSEDDPKREQLIKDFHEMRQRIADTKTEIYGTKVSLEDLAKAEEALHQKNEQILKDGTQLNASYTQMKAAAALLEEQLDNTFTDDAGRDKLKTDLQQLKQRMSDYKAEVNTVVQSQEELDRQQAELHKSNMQIILDGKQLDASYDQMKASAAQLEKQLHSLPKNAPERKQMIKDYQDLGKRLDEAKQEMAGVQKASLAARLGLDGVTSASGLMKLGFQAAVAAFLPLLAFQTIVDLGRSFLGLVDNIDKVKGSIQQLTGAQGEVLDQMYVRVDAISKTFNEEYNEVIKSANVLMKEFGLNHKEAFDLVEKGYLSGANTSGDMLEQIKEYSTQFAISGASAEEFIQVLAKGENAGIFSDKAADTVKEFGLRIREQTKATGEAMDAAFGQEFTDKIFKGINSGSMTTMDALRQVSKEMNNTKIPASQLQTVIADVFGGAGEDAGLPFIQSLHEVNGNLDEMINNTNILTSAQIDQLEANKELAEAQEELGESFSGMGSNLSVLWTQIKTVGAQIMVNWINDWKALKNEVNGLIASFSSLGTSIADMFNALMEGDFSGVADAFYKTGEKSRKAYWEGYTKNIKQELEDKKILEKQEADQAAEAATELAKKEAEATRKEKEKAAKDAAREAERLRKEEQRNLQRALEEYNNAKAKAELEMAQLKIEMMDEGIDKVLAKLRFQHEQEIKEVESQQKRILDNKYITEEQKVAIEAEFAELKRLREEELKLAEEAATEEAKAAKKEKDQEEFFTQLEEEEEYQMLAKEEQFLRAFDAEAAREQALLELHQQTLEQKLAYLVAAGEGETAEALKLKNEILKIEKEKTDKAKALAKERATFDREMALLRVAVAGEALDGIMGFMNEESAAFQIFKAIRKTVTLAEIALNLEKEMALNAATAAANPLNAVTGGAAGITQLKIMNTLSAVRAGISAAKVIAFEQGGMTRGDKTIPMVQVGNSWQMLSGHSGGSIGTFADGGWVNNAQLGLIGEAGRELVIPNWMVESPKYANLVGYLEGERQRGIKAYADGGSTGAAISPVADPAADQVTRAIAQLLLEISGMRQDVAAWPTKLEVHNNVGDTRDKIQLLNDLETNAFA
jgi:hypothetical protein